MTTYYPQARRTGLNIQELADETLIFDTENDQANCLNAVAAHVWKHADGTHSVADIAAHLTQTLHAPTDPRVVWYALEQLSKKHLLVTPLPIPPAYARMTRRSFLTKAGVAGAAVAIPVIVSIVAPTPAHAQSGCVADGQSCSTSAECCSKCCSPGSNTCFPTALKVLCT